MRCTTCSFWGEGRVLTTETLRRPYSVLHAVAFCDAACSKKFNWEADHSKGVGLHDWCVRRPPMHLLVPMAVFYGYGWR
eukprot:COSAG01_NODE_1130_length_11575_cov_6.349773_1_plen_79_part_00